MKKETDNTKTGTTKTDQLNVVLTGIADLEANMKQAGGNMEQAGGNMEANMEQANGNMEAGFEEDGARGDSGGIKNKPSEEVQHPQAKIPTVGMDLIQICKSSIEVTAKLFKDLEFMCKELWKKHNSNQSSLRNIQSQKDPENFDPIMPKNHQLKKPEPQLTINPCSKDGGTTPKP